MNYLLDKNILVTTSDWFMAPDGIQYKAIYGKLTKIYNAKELIGFDPARQHTNWVYQIGSATIMGCRIMYAIECTIPPNMSTVTDFNCEKAVPSINPAGHRSGEYERPSYIFNASTENEQ